MVTNWLAIGSRLFGFAMQYPFERHLKPDFSESVKSRKELEKLHSSHD